MAEYKTKPSIGTQIKGVNCPRTGRPLYLAPNSECGIRIGKAGTTGSHLASRDEVVYMLQRLDKSERRILRKALFTAEKKDLAAFDVRGN